MQVVQSESEGEKEKRKREAIRKGGEEGRRGI
jgi:hypothetical protein